MVNHEFSKKVKTRIKDIYRKYKLLSKIQGQIWKTVPILHKAIENKANPSNSHHPNPKAYRKGVRIDWLAEQYIVSLVSCRI